MDFFEEGRDVVAPEIPPKPSAAGSRKEAEQRSEQSLAFLGRREGYGACFDDKQEKALPLFRRPGGHICPQCGQNGDSPLTLFRCGETGIDADSRKSRKTRAFSDAIHEKGPIHANGKQ